MEGRNRRDKRDNNSEERLTKGWLSFSENTIGLLLKILLESICKVNHTSVQAG